MTELSRIHDRTGPSTDPRGAGGSSWTMNHAWPASPLQRITDRRAAGAATAEPWSRRIM